MTILTFRIIFFSAATALAFTPVIAWAVTRLGLVDVPGSAPHKVHARTMPLAGGFVLLLTTFVVGPILGITAPGEIRAFLFPSLVVFTFGVWDDVRGLSAGWKILGQALAGFWLIQNGVYVRLFAAEWQWINLAITLVWVVGISNAFNFVDSMDGLTTGLAGLAAAFFMLVTFDAGQVVLSAFATLLLGACIGTYFYNAAPARMFMGDAGAQWLGFCLAAVAISYTPQGFLRSQSWFVPILLVGVPIFDTALIVFSRLRRRAPWYLASFDHTYHRLVKLGVSPGRAVLAMHVTALLLGCLAFVALSLQPVWANGLFALCLTMGGCAAVWLERRWIEAESSMKAETGKD